jgi:hypothetical protein
VAGPLSGYGNDQSRSTTGQPGGNRQCPVASRAGIRCALEVRDDGTHEGEHYFVPARPEDRPVKLPARDQVIVVPDPDTAVRYVSTSDSMLLRQFCQQHDLMSFFALAVAKSPHNLHGNVMITEELYWQIRGLAEGLSMGASEVRA